MAAEAQWESFAAAIAGRQKHPERWPREACPQGRKPHSGLACWELGQGRSSDRRRRQSLGAGAVSSKERSLVLRLSQRLDTNELLASEGISLAAGDYCALRKLLVRMSGLA